MARRNVYGNDFSENGWPMVDEGSCQWIAVPGTDVHLEIQIGIPLALLRAFAADFNAYVEPLRDADSACWTPGNSVATSNHLSGSACDLDWDSHPFQVFNAGFNDAQIATIRELLAFYTYSSVQLIWWGNDWDSPKDAMHFQVGYNTFNNQGICNEFILKNIRPDGFSTFRRGNTIVTPDTALILSRATGLGLDLATEILPTMQSGLQQAECTNPLRIAMFIAQTGTESANFDATEEYASGAEYEGRADLGNTEPGDGVRFKGRTWIQITGRHNYGQFSQWAFDNGLVPTSTYFVDNPTELSDLKWAGIGAAWYWTVARPTINSFCDQGDVVTVTHLINGGENGLADRQTRYTRAMAQGDQLLTLLTGDEDFMSALSADEQRELLDNSRQQVVYARPSKSPLRHLGEGNVNTCAGFAWSADGLTHPQFVLTAARVGHADSIALIAEVASADLSKYPDRADDKALAISMLADLESNYPTALKGYLAAKGAA